MQLEAITPANRAEVDAFLVQHWFSTTMAIRGQLFDMTSFDGLFAKEDGAITGLITWRFVNDACEIMSLDSILENRGVGSALLNAAEDFARTHGSIRTLLISTNDNLRALSFYRKRGYALKALYPDAVTEARRRFKPEIPLVSPGGIPVRDEIELEKLLQDEPRA